MEEELPEEEAMHEGMMMPNMMAGGMPMMARGMGGMGSMGGMGGGMDKQPVLKWEMFSQGKWTPMLEGICEALNTSIATGAPLPP